MRCKTTDFLMNPFHRKRLETVLWMLSYAKDAVEEGEQPWDVIMAAHNMVDKHLNELQELHMHAHNRTLHDDPPKMEKVGGDK